MKKIVLFLIVLFVVSACNSGDGKIKKVKLEKDETILESFANGSPRIVRVMKEKDGKNDFEYEKEYYEDGNLLKEGPIVDNSKNGTWKSYYRDGTLWSETNFVKGQIDGLSKSYYPNGKLKYEGSYQNGVKTGQWNLYKEDGTFDRMATYMLPGTNDSVTFEIPSEEVPEGDR
jgi:antitoxin component YwqK of YwqJK toxin-antitoxin module